MKAMLRIAAVAAVVAGLGSEPVVAAEPVGACPTFNNQLTALVYIADLQQSNSTPAEKGWARVLTKMDENQDGYACALVRCTPCPPTAQRCNIRCEFVGPPMDNDVY